MSLGPCVCNEDHNVGVMNICPPLTLLLQETFPRWEDLEPTCWVYEAVDQQQNDFGELIECLELAGAHQSFIARLRAAHPVRAIHNSQHDHRLLDVFTEGAAFAWALRVAKLGRPRFVTEQGAPDITVEDIWLEVKNVRNSQEEEQFKEEVLNPHLRRHGIATRGPVTLEAPPAGFSESSNQTSITRSSNGNDKVELDSLSSTTGSTSISAFQAGLRAKR